jgi:Haem-binding domain
MLKKILLILLIIVVIAQFIQPPLNKGNAMADTDITHVVHVPDSIMSILKTSCYDCHSNSTTYPWYNRVTPVNWWLKNHVDDGKKHLNFTTYLNYDAKQKDHKLEEISETIDKLEMPLPSYLWTHGDAGLSDLQKKSIIEWTKYAREELKKPK